MIVAKARGLTKIYGEGDGHVVALTGLDIDIHSGTLTAIMGPSGSGKSTLMQLLAGLDDATSGSIELDGIELTGLTDDARTVLRRGKIGFVFQAFNLVPTLNVLGNVLLPFELDGLKPSIEEREWVDHLLVDLSLADLTSRRPHELSSGQQQRVAIARALGRRPSVVFADEPTGALDSRTGRHVLSLLRKAVEDYQQTVVLVTHDPVAASFADRVVFLADGTIADDLVGRSDARILSDIVLGPDAAA